MKIINGGNVVNVIGARRKVALPKIRSFVERRFAQTGLDGESNIVLESRSLGDSFQMELTDEVTPVNLEIRTKQTNTQFGRRVTTLSVLMYVDTHELIGIEYG